VDIEISTSDACNRNPGSKSKSPPSFAKNTKEGWGTRAMMDGLAVAYDNLLGPL
jgi:hypothetical protein